MLYDRMHRAMLLSATHALRDHVAMLWHMSRLVVSALATESEGSNRRLYMESVFPDTQRVLLSWSGLIHQGSVPMPLALLSCSPCP